MKKNIGILSLAILLVASSVQAQVVGYIGTTLKKMNDGSFKIVALTNTAPAAKAGAQAGDLILAVRSVPATELKSVLDLSLEHVVKLIRGPMGIPVEILIAREGKQESIVIIREKLG